MATKTKLPRKRDLRKLWEQVNLEGKTPPKNEKVWFENPLIAFLYAKYKKGEPYSEELEKLFYGNLKAIYCYCYWVVKDLGKPLPEHLNNYMIAKSIEDDSDEWIRIYFDKFKK